MKKLLLCLALYLLAPSAQAQTPTLDCYEDTPNYYLCYAWPANDGVRTYQWYVQSLSVGYYIPGQPDVNPSLVAFECWPLQPTRLPNGYYAQTVVSTRVYVTITPLYNNWGTPYAGTTSDDVTCRSAMPLDVGLPEQPVEPEPPLPPENPEHDFWWFLRILVSGYRYWDSGVNFNCATYGLCSGESPYNDQQ